MGSQARLVDAVGKMQAVLRNPGKGEAKKCSKNRGYVLDLRGCEAEM